MKKKIRILLKEWQDALQAEILYLKKYGSSKYLLTNGRLLEKKDSFTYYFETSHSIRVPIGANIKIQWTSMEIKGRILSSEGKSLIIDLEKNIGDFLTDVYFFHDPWELLEQLSERLDEAKKNKRKLARMKRLMEPSDIQKYPTENIKSNVHELMLRSQYNPVTFVWGPPGTGKTFTLARVAANKYLNGKKILVMAHSNQAVDVLMAEIASILKNNERFKEGDILRYGSQTSSPLLMETSITSIELLKSFHPDLAERKEQLSNKRREIKYDLSKSFSKRDSDQLLEIELKLTNILEKIRQKEVQLVKDAKIIGATLAKAASDPALYEGEYDLVMVDEASMAFVPQMAFAAILAKRLIVCGDFKQLPPIAIGRHPLIKEWLREDIFHKSGVTESVKDGYLHPHLLLLKEQRRMHPDISAFTNKHVYHSLVKDHKSVIKSQTEIVKKEPFPGKASILVDVSYTGLHCLSERISNSRVNLWNLLISFQLIYESYLSGTRSLGYVTPYRAQAELMENLLDDIFQKEKQEADIIAATVHRFQGSERNVMIFDSVDSFPQERPGMLLIGNDSERLINVAITRTREKFIHVNDTSFIQNQISKGKTIRKLVEHQFNNNQVIFQKEIGTWIKHQHKHLSWIHAKKLDQVFQDIGQARSSIVISFPKKGLLTENWRSVLNKRSKRTALTFVSSDLMENLEIDYFVKHYCPFPFVLIDQRIMWLGLPLEGASRVMPPYVCARLNSEAISQFLLTQLPIGN